MKRLIDLIEVFENNEECVILKVLPDSRDELIKLGCFKGNEDMFRLTKGGTKTCTVFYDDRKTFSWHWSHNGAECVSDTTAKEGRMIQECIEDYLDICLNGSYTAAKYSLRIQCKKDAEHGTHVIKVMGEKEDCVHKDDNYIKCEKGIQNVIKRFNDFGFNVVGDIVESTAGNGCPIKTFTIQK